MIFNLEKKEDLLKRRLNREIRLFKGEKEEFNRLKFERSR